jgi:hypothetical protein
MQRLLKNPSTVMQVQLFTLTALTPTPNVKGLEGSLHVPQAGVLELCDVLLVLNCISSAQKRLRPHRTTPELARHITLSQQRPSLVFV